MPNTISSRLITSRLYSLRETTGAQTNMTVVGQLMALALAAMAREEVVFDYAWRHQLGEVPPSGSSVPVEAAAGFNDSAWSLVDTPHDMLITGNHSPNNDPTQGFLARGVGWYRKQFALPSEWKNQAVWLWFEGAFHVVTIFVNGQPHSTHRAGYTSFAVHLNATAVFGGPNVIAIRADASTGTGWWYEGGGLTRHVTLVAASPLHAAPAGAWGHGSITGPITARASPSDGAWASSAVVTCETPVHNFGGEGEASIAVRIVSPSGDVLASASSAKRRIASGGVAALAVNVTLPTPVELWSIGRPHLYLLAFSIRVRSP